MATKTTKAETPAKAESPKKEAPEVGKRENRYVRAFSLIADDPKIAPEKIAQRASMSTGMAGACIVAWDAAVAILGQKEVLAVDATELGHCARRCVPVLSAVKGHVESEGVITTQG